MLMRVRGQRFRKHLAARVAAAAGGSGHIARERDDIVDAGEQAVACSSSATHTRRHECVELRGPFRCEAEGPFLFLGSAPPRKASN